jgi:hypothetical protein
MIKKIKDKKNKKTVFTIKETQSPKGVGHGIRKIVTLRNGDGLLSFQIDVTPFLWGEGSVFIEFKVLDVKGLVIPSNKITPMKKGHIWKLGYTSTDFIVNSATVMQYLAYAEFSAADVGFFDSISASVNNFLGTNNL